MEPTPMTPTRIGAAGTGLRKLPGHINAWRWFAESAEGLGACASSEAPRPGAKPSYRFVSSSPLRGQHHGDRPGLREAGESAQRVLDDLVQGDALLLRHRRLPIEVRPQAGALPTGHPRPASEASRLLSRPQSFTRNFATPRPAASSTHESRNPRARSAPVS